MKRRISLREAALGVVRRLREQGHEALWAGGCVRDMLLGHQPTDIDVATDAPPERISELFTHTRKVGAKFGVVMVRQGRHWIETATFRTDLDYTDGRRPDGVVFTNAEEDARRRDFTINGLFYDPLEDRVIDYVSGRADLEAGVIRAIGEPARRFAEDHLRMVRAVRFATRLGFTIEPETAGAIREHAARITRISPERIREELDKMFRHPSRAEAVELIAELGLLAHLWPGSAWEDGDLDRAVAVLTALPRHADFVLSLAALLHGQPPPEARRITQALRCSNVQTGDMTWLVAHAPELDRAATMPLAAFKKLLAHDRFADLLSLHAAICAAEGRPLEANEAARRRREDIPPHQIAPPPLITGEDLIAQGLVPGPRFSEILERLYDAQLDEALHNRAEALEHLRRVVAEKES